MLGKKEENESGELGAFTNLDKTLLVLDSRTFNEIPLSAKRCHAVLSKLLFVLYNGGVFDSNDATSIFFNVIKVFQSKEMSLRRLMYIVLKELASSAQDILMATSSLVQDINGQKLDPTMKSDALRALGRIIDPSMINSVERLLKQMMLDRNPSMVSASLVTSIHLFAFNKDVVRRWSTEVQQVLNSAPRTSIAQYHALGLLYLMKQGDRMSITKILDSINAIPCGPLTTVLFLKIYSQSITSSHQQQSQQPIDLKSYLRGKGKQEMVSLEAVRVMCEHPHLYEDDLVFAVSVLQNMVGSSRPLSKLAAIRTLNRLANTHPGFVSTCNRDIEGLVSDSNRSIATFAITTLLKTGSEDSVDRLVNQVSSYVSEISDDFKVVVVKAVRELCFKFPNKASSLLEFFGNILRDEGSFDYKKNVLQSIEDLLEIEEGDDSNLKERVLQSLCEFIEDCEYPGLTVQVLHLLGEKGADLGEGTSKLIRYIYNRMVLEGPRVRLSAIQALTKLSVLRPDLKTDIIPLLRLGAEDMDDEVRETAGFGLESIQNLNEEEQRYLFDGRIAFDLNDLEKKLEEYQSNVENYAHPFSLKDVKETTREELFHPIMSQNPITPMDIVESSPAKMEPVNNNVEDIVEFIGDDLEILLSKGPILLTDENAECMVSVIKHLLLNKDSKKFQLLLEYIIENTENDLEFSNLKIIPSNHPFIKKDKDIDSLKSTESKSYFVLFEEFKQRDLLITNQISFTIGRSEEKFNIDNVELGLSDFVLPITRDVFIEGGDDDYRKETFHLTAINNINDGVRAIKDLIGGHLVDSEGDSEQKIIQLQGELIDLSGGRCSFICKCIFRKMQKGTGVELTMQVSSDRTQVIEEIMSLIG